MRQYDGSCFYYAARGFVAAIVDALGAKYKAGLPIPVWQWIYGQSLNDEGRDMACVAPDPEVWSMYAQLWVAERGTFGLQGAPERLPKRMGFLQFLKSDGPLGATRKTVLDLMNTRLSPEYWAQALKALHALSRALSPTPGVLPLSADRSVHVDDLTDAPMLANLFLDVNDASAISPVVKRRATDGGDEGLLALAALLLCAGIDVRVKALQAEEEPVVWTPPPTHPENVVLLRRHDLWQDEILVFLDDRYPGGVGDITHLLRNYIARAASEDSGAKRRMLAATCSFDIQELGGHAILLLPCVSDNDSIPQIRVVDSGGGRRFESVRAYLDHRISVEISVEEGGEKERWANWKGLRINKVMIAWHMEGGGGGGGDPMDTGL